MSTITTNFVFLEDGTGEEARRRIRSVATRYSHHAGDRKPKSKTGERLSTRRRRKRKVVVKTEAGEGESVLEGFEISWRVDERTAGIKKVGEMEQGEEEEEEKGLVDEEERSSLDSCFARDLFVKTPSPRKTTLAPDLDNPFETYPVPAQPWFSRLLFHLNDFMLRGWASLPMSDGERDKGLVFVQRLSREHSTYFYMNLLSIAGDLNDKGQINAQLIPYLTAQVVSSVNEAVSDSSRTLSPVTIMTVGRIMFHETFLGDPEVGQNVHRRAFARMVLLAGGVDALKLPKVVKCSWAWMERLLARKTGVAIGDMEPSLRDFCGEREDERGVEEDLSVLRGYHERREWREEEL